MRVFASAVLTVMALAIGGCAAEQKADIGKLSKAPKLPSEFRVADVEDPKTDGPDWTFGYVYESDNGNVYVQITGSEDVAGSTWRIDSAEPIVADLSDTKPVKAEPFEFASPPASVGAWAGSTDSGPLFAEAWERNQCVAVAITSVPRADAKQIFDALDAHLIAACGE